MGQLGSVTLNEIEEVFVSVPQAIQAVIKRKDEGLAIYVVLGPFLEPEVKDEDIALENLVRFDTTVNDVNQIMLKQICIIVTVLVFHHMFNQKLEVGVLATF